MIEYGLLLAITLGIMKGFQGVHEKRSVGLTDEYVSAWSVRAFGILPALPAVLLTGGVPETIKWEPFLTALGVSGSICVVATVLIAKAYKHEDVSFVVPLFALSPALLLITSPIIIGEFPSPIGLIGVALITAGTYLLKARGKNESLLEPFRLIVTNRSAKYVFVVLILYSISANFDKIGASASSPLFWTTSFLTVASLGLAPIMMHFSDNWWELVKEEKTALIILGLLSGGASLLQMTAITETLVIYVSALKRLSIPVSVILGYVLFGEDNIRGRLPGSLLMMVGAIITTYAI